MGYMMMGGIDSGRGEPTPDARAVLEPELYDPYANKWHLLKDPSPSPRNYHSVALLMPDGAVWSAGSDKDAGRGPAARNLDIDIYEPCPSPIRWRSTIAPNSLCWQRQPGRQNSRRCRREMRRCKPHGSIFSCCLPSKFGNADPVAAQCAEVGEGGKARRRRRSRFVEAAVQGLAAFHFRGPVKWNGL